MLLFSLTQFDFAGYGDPKSRIKWLGKCGVYFVQKSHCVRDTVEAQSSCPVIHIHSYSGAGH